jgi:hypothetical protein
MTAEDLERSQREQIASIVWDAMYGRGAPFSDGEVHDEDVESYEDHVEWCDEDPDVFRARHAADRILAADAIASLRSAERRVAELEERVAALAKWLSNCPDAHLPSCATGYGYGHRGECDCGLAALLSTPHQQAET